jgi:biotin-(acetyl-CoA carboxylase) ligase
MSITQSRPLVEFCCISDRLLFSAEKRLTMFPEMSEPLALPPLYVDCPLAVDSDVMAIAKQFAIAGTEGGSFFHARSRGKLAMALVLAPEKNLLEALSVAYPLQLALGDALGACLPPQVAVHFLWPDRLLLNGAQFGKMKFLAPESDLLQVPSWLVAGLALQVAGEAKGEGPLLHTSLEAENLATTDLNGLQESFARYFLKWLHDWEAGGIQVLAPHYLARIHAPDTPQEFPSAEGILSGQVQSIAADGALMINVGNQTRDLPLAVLLQEGAHEAPSPS